MNSSIVTSLGSLFSLSLMWDAIAIKDKLNITIKPSRIKFEDKLNV